MARIVLFFSSARTAGCLVAGIPAAARAVREVALASSMGERVMRCSIAIPGGWQPSIRTRAELARLGDGLEVDIVDADALDAGTPDADAADGTAALIVDGAALPSARTIEAALVNPPEMPPGTGWAIDDLRHPAADAALETRSLAALRRKGREIIAATKKPGDGVVSTYINRPVSQTISRFLLLFPAITPTHATTGTAALGIAMAACLLCGGGPGLIAGALLFQAASIFDGVDGEMARATFRTSSRGAALDSLTDAATNLAFVAGVAINLWLQGYEKAALAGAGGLVMLATGLYLIGRRSRAMSGPFTFDVVKDHFRARKSPLMQWLTWLTMRDFYALASALMILAGLAPQLMTVFAVVAAGWLAVTCKVLLVAAKR